MLVKLTEYYISYISHKNTLGLFFLTYFTLVQLNCFYCIFCHLKLELLTQFPTLNDENYFYFKKIYIFNLNYLTNWPSTTNYIIHIIHFNDV